MTATLLTAAAALLATGSYLLGAALGLPHRRRGRQDHAHAQTPYGAPKWHPETDHPHP